MGGLPMNVVGKILVDLYKTQKEIYKKQFNQNMINDIETHKIISFYFNDNETEIKEFIKKCIKKRKTSLMLNRIKWFIELADYQKYDSVKLFFLIALAEINVRIIENKFNCPNNQSTDVKKFFNTFDDRNKNKLLNNFINQNTKTGKMRYDTIIEILLNARHILSHGKNHYSFNFHDGGKKSVNLIDGEYGNKNKKIKVFYELKLTYNELKKLIIKNAINNIYKAFN